MISKFAGRLVPLNLALVVIGYATGALQAQSDVKEKAEREAAQRQELEKNARKLLDQAIGDAGGLKLRENRAYVLGVAADVLWSYDEKRARTIFWEALAAINVPTYPEVSQSPTQETSNSTKTARFNAPTKEQQEKLNKYHAQLNARNNFLYKVARHDPQLALDMLRSTRMALPPNVPGMNGFDQDAQLEQEFTVAAAASDPKRALQLARESLAKGLPYQVLNLLREINRKDQDAGTQLAGEIITRLETENFNAANSFAPFVAVDLLQSSREGGAILAMMNEMESSPPITRLKLDEHQKQDLVYLLTEAALNATGGGHAIQTIPMIMPEIEQYAPDRLPKLKARLADYDRTLPSQVREWQVFNSKFEKSTPEQMLKAAGEVSDDQRRALFFQAASKAVASGEVDRYRELVNNLYDETQRKLALDALDREQMNDDIARGKTDDLEKLVALIRVKEQRAIAMSQLALQLEKKDQHEAAVKLLDEARTLVKVDLANEEQSNALLAVMFASALVDPPKAFAMIEPAVDHTNDQVSKLALVDKVVKTGGFKDGEIILNQPQMSLDFAITQYSAGLVALGEADFDRTKALADRFQRNELKVAARLLIAQAMLRASVQTRQTDLR